MRHLPNLICLLRIALIWPVVLAIAEGAYPRALLWFFIAAASDGVDGFLAKRFHWTSELGKFLDPAADKLLLLGVFLAATWYGLIPSALTGIVIARDVMIALGALIYLLAFGPLHGRPLWSSKLNTLVQVLYVLAVVAHAGYGMPALRVLQSLAALMLLTVLVSGYVYASLFTRRALTAEHA
ncbi:MAG TPA: CDP-alcohol phosphatidyltransferase family protein [Steroidobacteraceae bacterium]|nr:CDP-alcohol phosphatidyltransferase family protein [Steroidobacteraceae bacterium]